VIFGNKRCEIEIICQILSLAKEPRKKTHLMYKTNMSYTLFMKYFHFLLKKNLIRKHISNPEKGVYYCLTKKGEKLLESFNNVLDQLK